MTATLTLEAQHQLDRYLQEVRLLLSGTSGVDASEVEGDIREHIETELGGREEAITAEELDRVLRRLGSPSQWVGEDEIPAWRRALTRLYLGEDWRLAYLCLGISVIGAVLLFAGSPISVVLFAAGFLLARAAISLAEERGEELGPRRWLVLAPILIVVVPVLLVVLAGPFIPLGQVGYEEGWFSSLGLGPASVDGPARVALVTLALVSFGAGAWWLVLAGLWNVVRRLLTPVTRPVVTYQPTQRRWLAISGLVLAVAGVVALVLLATAGAS
ncbi:MAG: hypothetical protein LJE95_05990 [Acidobacteria bacterium]|jgi:hypothetical protein|nr:hypothetical protein [Acidobacteriota bacterium]